MGVHITTPHCPTIGVVKAYHSTFSFILARAAVIITLSLAFDCSSYQWSDVAFYTSTALLLLLLGPIFPLPLNNGGLLDLRFPGMVVLGASVLAERTLLSTLAQHGLLTPTGQV